MRWVGGAVGGFSALCAVASCGGEIDSSCGSFYDEYLRFFTECSIDSAVTIDSSDRAAFIQDCEALAKAPGQPDVAGLYDQCTNLLKSTQACAIFPRCNARGSLTNGSACASGIQCASGFCNAGPASTTSELVCGTCSAFTPLGADCNLSGTLCDPSTACVHGVCVALVTEGGTCSFTDQDCAPNLVCNNGTCQPPPTQGQACSDNVCVIPNLCINGTCAQPVAQGGSCPTGDECVGGLVCTNGICSQPVFAQAGQSCMMAPCAVGLYCSTTGTCAAKVALGGACTVGQGECADWLLCVSGTCQVPDYSACN